MAKTSFMLVPLGLEELKAKTFSSSDRFVHPSVRRKPVSVPRKRKVALTQKSIMPGAKLVWDSLTTTQKDAWTSASVFGHASGWQLFLRDYAIRLQLDLSVPGVPNDIEQYKVGHVEIAGSATEIKLEQIHPLVYYVQKKVSGTRDQYRAVQIVESFALPLELQISYKSNLTQNGDNPFCKMFALVLSHYQGRDIETPVELNMELVSEWDRISSSLETVLGLIKGYSVYIHAKNVHGEFWFDNVAIIHSGQNWARDPQCNSINTEFTKVFYQIPRHWAPEIMEIGAYFDSVYFDSVGVDNARHLPFNLGEL